MVKTTQRFQRIATLADLNAEGLNAQTVNDFLSMYVGAATQHVLRMSIVPEKEAKNFDMEVTAFWSQLIQHDATSPLFFLPLKLGGLGRLNCSAACSCTMARLAIGHPDTHGHHSVPRHRHPFQHCTTTPSPTCSTSNRTLTTDEQASLPPQTTWLSPSPKSHTKEARHHNPTTFPQAAS